MTEVSEIVKCPQCGNVSLWQRFDTHTMLTKSFCLACGYEEKEFRLGRDKTCGHVKVVPQKGFGVIQISNGPEQSMSVFLPAYRTEKDNLRRIAQLEKEGKHIGRATFFDHHSNTLKYLRGGPEPSWSMESGISDFDPDLLDCGPNKENLPIVQKGKE